ncbi:MAG TPA: VOC family protein [Usitatibacter sp.]|nr:VOC family protein [Usitatibacter sp.]
MAIEGMNHFNVLTDDVDATRRFYVGILGLEEGYRPPFSFDGLWLYAGGRPILHISAAKLPEARAGVIDHIAFTARDLKATIGRLEANRIKYRLNQQAGTKLWQVFCHDPMGAMVELDFDGSEPAPQVGQQNP